MPQIFWFLVGVASCLATTLLLGSQRRRLRGEGGDPTASDPRGDSDAAVQRDGLFLARRLMDETSRDVESVARGLGTEIASMASAIEGHAQLLCEAAERDHRAARSLISHRSEQLDSSVRRLRQFSQKILSFACVDDLGVSEVPVGDLLDGVTTELEDWGMHYRLELYKSEFLPDVLANRDALQAAIVFLIDTLLGLENRANRLSISAFAKVYEHQDTRVILEISAEADECGTRHEASRAAIQLGYVAARNLLEAQGARLSFDELEGLSVTCFINLPTAAAAREHARSSGRLASHDAAASAEPPAAELTPPLLGPRAPHQFGGVLVLEDDPALREMIAVELEGSGRKLVSCVDGASARSLIEATPERFELAILEHDARIESGAEIAALLAERCPAARVVLLTTSATPLGSDPPFQAIELRKPFRLAQLRATLRDALEPALSGRAGY